MCYALTVYKSVYNLNRYRKLFCLYKRSNGVYYYYIYKGSKRVHFSTGQKVKAKAFEVAMKSYNKRSEPLVIKNETITFKTFATDFYTPMSEYVEYRKAHGFTLTHGYLIRMNGIVQNRLIPQFGNKHLDEITTAEIERWFLSLSCSSKTKNAYLSALHTILKWAYKKGKVLEVATSAVSRTKNVKTYERGIYTKEEINTILSYTWKTEEYKIMCMLSVSTGMRLGEVLGLHIEDVGQDFIKVEHSWNNSTDGIKTPKSGKPRTVPLSSKVSILLQKYSKNRTSGLVFASGVEDLPNIQKDFRKAFIKMLETIIKDYKNRHLGFHSFRHYFNTSLVANGISGELIRAVIGHETESMTDNYLHIRETDLNGVRRVQETVLEKISGE